MMRRALSVVLVVLVMASACQSGTVGPAGTPVVVSASPSAPPSVIEDPTDSETPSSSPAQVPDGWEFGRPSAAFARAFSDDFYLDSGEEFAPFGSDEGSDVIADWYERRDEIARCTTVRQMLRRDDAEDLFDELDAEQPDLDATYIGYAFSLMYLRGHIDPEGKRYLLQALRDTKAFYGDDLEPTTKIIADVKAFAAKNCPT